MTDKPRPKVVNYNPLEEELYDDPPRSLQKQIHRFLQSRFSKILNVPPERLRMAIFCLAWPDKVSLAEGMGAKALTPLAARYRKALCCDQRVDAYLENRAWTRLDSLLRGMALAKTEPPREDFEGTFSEATLGIVTQEEDEDDGDEISPCLFAEFRETAE